jgi:hypothetical protein
MAEKVVIQFESELYVDVLLELAKTDAVIIKCDITAVFLREEFIRQFTREDNVVVGRRPLSPGWGLTLYRQSQANDKTIRLYTWGVDQTCPDGWRWLGTDESPREIIDQIETARQFRRRLSVDVFYV